MPAPVQSGRCPRESISIFLFIYFPSRPWQAALTAGIHAIASNSSDPQSIDGWQVLIDHRPAMRQSPHWRWGSERVNTHFSYSLAMRQSFLRIGVGGSERTDPHWLQLSDAAEPTLAPALAGQNGADARRREGEKSGAYFST